MQVLAGHATCATIMDIYTHVNMDSKRKAAEAELGRIEGELKQKLLEINK